MMDRAANCLKPPIARVFDDGCPMIGLPGPQITSAIADGFVGISGFVAHHLQ
jgi:hypothetical protein